MSTQDIPASVDPRLPPELERQIFETAALNRPICVPSLALVASRVREWIEPILYRTLVINTRPIPGFPVCSVADFRSIVNTRSSAFLRAAVKTVIAVRVLSADGKLMLRHFTGLETFYIISYDALWPDHNDEDTAFECPRLTRLYCDMTVLHRQAEDPPFAHPSLRGITHLEIFTHLFDTHEVHEWRALSALPCLTHLALNDDLTVELRAYILGGVCPALQVFLLLVEPEPYPTQFVKSLATDDVRFVVATVSGFREGLFGVCVDGRGLLGQGREVY
ncbi:hypothetical protein HMN09_00357000 [Mycena chlorophos]|uniref:Uncharacterized protein n=1 Tax=Mycena chlorophos TaxID=658473 RepID=A0A8H6TGW0_MYCCL|nr:hypothetical protein HMN09_00357000 [Mycena chlorophos]